MLSGRAPTKASRNTAFSILPGRTRLCSASIDIATFRNSRSRNGTRASTPHAAIAFLDRGVELVMTRAQRAGDAARRSQVGRAFQADREGMQAWPPGFLASVRLHATPGVAGHAGGDE